MPDLTWMWEWVFNPSVAHEFYFTKGVLGVVAVSLYLWHMNTAWPTLSTRSQRLRYLCLLYGSVLVTSASVEQVRDDAEVNWRNVGGMAFIVLLLYTAVVSIALDRRRYQSSV